MGAGGTSWGEGWQGPCGRELRGWGGEDREACPPSLWPPRVAHILIFISGGLRVSFSLTDRWPRVFLESCARGIATIEEWRPTPAPRPGVSGIFAEEESGGALDVTGVCSPRPLPVTALLAPCPSPLCDGSRALHFSCSPLVHVCLLPRAIRQPWDTHLSQTFF